METGMMWLFGVMFLVFILGIYAVGEAIKVISAEGRKKKSQFRPVEKIGRMAS